MNRGIPQRAVVYEAVFAIGRKRMVFHSLECGHVAFDSVSHGEGRKRRACTPCFEARAGEGSEGSLRDKSAARGACAPGPGARSSRGMRLPFQSSAKDKVSADVTARAGATHALSIGHFFHVEVFDDHGVFVESRDFKNLVVTVGRNKYLDAALVTGSALPTWYVGLITGPGAGNVYAAADTITLHAGWTENTAYAEAARQAWTPGAIAAGSVDNSAAKAVFTANAITTLAGAFLVNDATKGGIVLGTLLGEGNFTGGDLALQAGYGVQVTVTAVIT